MAENEASVTRRRAEALADVIELMIALRDPQRGCPWDREQTFETIAPYTVEEAYEVADAIARGDSAALRDELGDLLFQVVFHARIAEERGLFDVAAVADGLVAKMRRRHPHVFGDEAVDDAEEQSRRWDAIKASEREHDAAGALDGVSGGLPPLRRAWKLQQRAARVGFDWDDADQVLPKIAEELDEIRAARRHGERDAVDEELGDLLFSVVNLARHLELDPQIALARANAKFEHRFRTMEALSAEQGKPLDGQAPAALEALWERAKAR